MPECSKLTVRIENHALSLDAKREIPRYTEAQKGNWLKIPGLVQGIFLMANNT